MRLLLSDTSNGFQITEFDKPNIPKYAILSHRWRAEEVTYDDIIAGQPGDGAKWEKLRKSCERAHQDGFEYVWIDTCCIDKKSSAELSESINSMFRWYRKSAVCYAFLNDVEGTANPEADESSFRKSVWFTRGWTLQELIAPKSVLFLDADWSDIGSRDTLAEVVSQITNIECGVLSGVVDLSDVCVAKKMSWASKRVTLKVEDRAYSLLGIFGVNMTTIYGEGRKAFVRLQQEIMRHSSDYTIFAWDTSREGDEHPEVPADIEKNQYALLAPSPDEFVESEGFIGVSYSHFARLWSLNNSVPELRLTNIGIWMEVPLIPTAHPLVYLAVLACRKRNIIAHDSLQYSTVAIALYQHSYNQFARLQSCGLIDVDCLKNLGIEVVPHQLYADDVYDDDDDDTSSESSDVSDASDNDDAAEKTQDDDEESGSVGDKEPESNDEDSSDEGGNEGDEGESDAADTAQNTNQKLKKVELVLNAPTLRFLREDYGYVLDHKGSDFGTAKTNLQTVETGTDAEESLTSFGTNQELDITISSEGPENITIRFSARDPDSSLTLSIDVTIDGDYPAVWDVESEMYWNEQSGSTTPGVMHQSRTFDDNRVVEVMFTQIGTTFHEMTFLVEILIHGALLKLIDICNDVFSSLTID